MSDELPVYCWDSCILLEHIRKEDVHPLKKQKILSLLQDNKDQKNVIFVSVITHLECLPKKLTADDVARENEYRSLFGTRFFYDVPIDAQILTLAREIRDFYFQEGDPKTGQGYKMMDLGDAIHLATAIINGATELHTRDKDKKGRKVPLLGLAESSLNGKIAGRWELKIVSPEEDQRAFELTQGTRERGNA